MGRKFWCWQEKPAYVFSSHFHEDHFNYTLGGRQFIERFKVGLFAPMHFFWEISKEGEQKDGKGKADVFANAIKHDFRSKNPTTRWSDIIELK